ncbi:MAG TPA: hypothetical protein VF494_11165 [Candidatus Limnocylindrales bacterium]
MKNRLLRLGVLALLAAACTSSPVPSPDASSLAPSPGSSQGPTPETPSPSRTIALAPCAVDQLDLTAGHSGGAGGTNYLTVFVELSLGPTCALPESPKVTIAAPDGAVVASSGEPDLTPFPLAFIDRYRIGWTADCRTFPSGDFTARVEFSPTVVIDLPIGSFRPSQCMNPSGETLFMSADQPPE